MTTNRQAANHRYAARLHTAIAVYLELKDKPISEVSNAKLQGVWHNSFEHFGPAFADEVDFTEDDYLRGRL
jgi:hypothetical protein